MSASDELEALDALLASPGWQYFMAHADKQWGAQAYRDRAQQILKALPEGGDASSKLLQLECAAREIEALVAYPRERLSKLRASAQRRPR